MKKRTCILLLPLILLAFHQFKIQPEKEKWKLDRGHSKITFTVTHLLISEVEGRFHDFDADIYANPNDWTNPNIEIIIKTKTLDTDNEDRDKHLRSADFFDVERYPEIKFKVVSMKKISEKNYKIKGNMTIKNITKTIDLDAKYGGMIEDPIDGKTKAGFKVWGNINRYDFGLKWNISSTAELTAVSPEVAIECFVRLEKYTNKK